jgi:DnaD/phage-associated family protein
MRAKYWIKLYHEILDDGKMGRLPDRLWRRAIELFLIAGEEHEGGRLPSLEDMTWRLRLSEDELLEDLQALAKVKIVTQLENGTWLVTNFAERQRARTNAERQKRYRERQRKAQYYGDSDKTDDKQDDNDTVTECNTEVDVDVDKDVDKDVDVEVDTSDRNPFRLYEQANGTLSPLIADKLGDLIDEMEEHRYTIPPPAKGSGIPGDEWVCRAIEEAAESTDRFNLKYLQRILDRWKEDGLEAPFNGGGDDVVVPKATHVYT